MPGVTIDRQCGSSQQAVHFAAQAVMSGTSDLVVAGGVQNMSAIPISSAMTLAQPLGFTDPFSGSKGWVARYGAGEVSQFRGAEMIAEKWDITREDMEAFALESHQRAIRAIDEGRFENEIAPLGDVARDEGPRRDTSLEKMAKLKTAAAGRPPHGGGVEPDLGRRGGAADRVGARGEDARPRAARARAPHQRARRRSHLHADRADPGDAPRARRRPA